LEEIRSIEISPSGSYIVFNYDRFVHSVRITPHKQLQELINPIYLIKNIVLFLNQNEEDEDFDDKINTRRDAIRKRVSKNPKLLPNSIRTVYEALLKG
jgi:hypothetical protein